MQESALLVGLPYASLSLLESCLADLRLQTLTVADASELSARAVEPHLLVVCELPLAAATAEELVAAVKPASPATAVILIAGPPGGPEVSAVAPAGADECLARPLDREKCTRAVVSALLKRQLALHAQADGTGPRRAAWELLAAAIEAWTQAMEERGKLSSGHACGVASLAARLAKHQVLSDEDTEAARLAGALHDLGKLGVRSEILDKPGSLSPTEWEEVRRHPEAGAAILSHIDGLAALATYVRHHHERHDGRGYPEGLRDDEIPLISRIVAVADAYDAMVRPRPYRPRGGPAYAARELRAHSGKQWDPEIVEGLFACVPELRLAG